MKLATKNISSKNININLLTKDVFKVTEVKPQSSISKDELIGFAAYAESFSNHPIATSILKAYDKEIVKDAYESNKNRKYIMK